MDIVCQNMTIASASTPAPMIVSPMAGRGRTAESLGCGPAMGMSRQPKFLEDAFDPRCLAFEEGLVVVAYQRDWRPVPGLAGLGPLRCRNHLLHQCNHRLALGVVDAGRREHAPPVEQLHVDALLLQGGGVDSLLALVRRYGDHPQL